MPAKRYIVSLTNDERQTLEQLTKTGKAAASRINHARILGSSVCVMQWTGFIINVTLI